MNVLNSKTAPPLVIGQHVYCGLYGGRMGILFNIRGEQRPESIKSLGGGGAVVMGGSASFDIVFEVGGISRGVPESIVRGVQWRIYDTIAGPADIALALAHAEQERLRKEEEARLTAQRHERERAQHRQDNPHLIQARDKHGWSGERVAAENIRRELKRAFPGVKFSVTSKGNCVDVRWTCGPTVKQVKALVDRHQGGHFDGMQDLYESDPDSTFADVFGKAKYVSCQRDYNDDGLEVCWKQMADAYGLDYQGHNTREPNCCDTVGDRVHRVLQKSPLGARLNGLERVENVKAGLAEDFWRAV